MRTVLTSYRWRRRLAWTSGSVAVAATLATLIVLLPKGSPRRIDVSAPTNGAPAALAPEPAEVRVTARQRRAVNRTLVAFITTAVTRDDPAAAWDLVTPEMRTGISRAEWNRGNLPVVPYPVVVPERPSWQVVTSYPGDLTIDVILQPRPGSRRPAASWFVELKRTRDGRWLVDSMVPEDFFAVAPPARPPRAQPSGEVSKPAYPKGRLSPLWIAVPLGLLGLIVVVPVTIALLSWRRQRAIDRRYRAKLEDAA